MNLSYNAISWNYRENRKALTKVACSLADEVINILYRHAFRPAFTLFTATNRTRLLMNLPIKRYRIMSCIYCH
jgi:hypothetical protein